MRGFAIRLPLIAIVLQLSVATASDKPCMPGVFAGLARKIVLDGDEMQVLAELRIEIMRLNRAGFRDSSGAGVPHSIEFGNKKYQVVDFLGGDREGRVFAVTDDLGKRHAIKQFKTAEVMSTSFKDGRDADASGIPNIVTGASLDTSKNQIRYQYVHGVSVDRIFADGTVAPETKAKFREAFEAWRQTYCFTSRFGCWPKNVVFDFDSRTFVFIDPS